MSDGTSRIAALSLIRLAGKIAEALDAYPRSSSVSMSYSSDELALILKCIVARAAEKME